MKLLSIIALTATFISAPVFAAEEFGTAKEAEAMVGKAVAHIKAVGKEKAFADFTGKKGR